MTKWMPPTEGRELRALRQRRRRYLAGHKRRRERKLRKAHHDKALREGRTEE